MGWRSFSPNQLWLRSSVEEFDPMGSHLSFSLWMFLPLKSHDVKSNSPHVYFIELDDGKFYRKALYLMVKTMVSCRFSLKPIQ